MSKRVIFRAALAASSLLAMPAQADNVEAIPTGWRLQDYTAGAIDIWYTGSTCTNGHLTLPASALADSKNRLWSLVMTALASNRKMGIYYHYDGTDCIIDNFYIGPNS